MVIFSFAFEEQGEYSVFLVDRKNEFIFSFNNDITNVDLIDKELCIIDD